MASTTADTDDTSDVETSWQPPAGTHPSVNLPLAFKIYYRKARLTHFEFYIGHQKDQVLHAISGGWEHLLHSKIGLHSGPETDSPLLGSAVIRSKCVEITLPSSGDTTHKMETTRTHFRTQSANGSFDLLVPGIPAPEHFEWVDSRGPEVQSLGNRDKTGWVLLRIGHGAELGEPVAAYAYDPWSWKLSGHFAFFNSGRTEALGGEFVVLAVLSALSLGQKKRVQYSGTNPVFIRD
jgi:hypothetical protein